ncbi:hypothetical protein SELSPUOL_00975 [Selenomonas sputigena ATCC 35185]|uniref:Uncharacterized protein n=1 Tax=Selenomonas sputigena (strain ATCC 35185 / DSM 20758 / CCUG 44933 / VPI D19B-28) TaxID=546271 RepID=C9LUG8_SELS3|nr:hypothetical protein SELSPUOL_00975 [Selenomonas sputigena ATCC 35185]
MVLCDMSGERAAGLLSLVFAQERYGFGKIFLAKFPKMRYTTYSS